MPDLIASIKYKLCTLIAASLMAPSPSMASDCDHRPDGAAFLMASKHANATLPLNETNPGLFLSWDCSETFTTRIGVYENSLGSTSWAVTWTSDLLSVSLGEFTAGPFGGIAHYPDFGRDVAVSIGGTDWIGIGGIEVTHDRLPVFVQILPGDQKQLGYSFLLTAGLQWHF